MVDFVFQNGEFILEKSSIFGISVDAIFTVAASLGTVYFSLWAKRKADARNEVERLLKLESYFFRLVELLQDPASRQASSLLTFSTSIGEHREQNFNLSYVSSFNVKPILEIDNRDLLTIFTEKRDASIERTTDLYKNVRNRVDLLSEMKNSLEPAFSEYKSKQQEYSLEYSRSFRFWNKYFDSLVSYNLSNNVSNASDPFLTKVDLLRANWINAKRKGVQYTDMFVAEKEVINPTIDLCREFLADARAIKMLDVLGECKQALNNIKSHKEVFSSSFKMKANQITESLEEINGSIQKLKQLNRV